MCQCLIKFKTEVNFLCSFNLIITDREDKNCIHPDIEQAMLPGLPRFQIRLAKILL